MFDNELKLFWDNMHLIKDANHLTGSKGKSVWNYLNVSNLVRKDGVVLNIGVGLGYDSYALKEKGVALHCLDISPFALRRVKNIATTWLPSELYSLPSDTFDLALSYLVTQHISNEDLLEQLKNVIRSLKKEGIFAMQFAFSTKMANKTIYSVQDLKDGGACRSLDYMGRLVCLSGGKIVWYSRPIFFPQYHSGWYAIHIKRKDSEINQVTFPDWLYNFRLSLSLLRGRIRKIRERLA